MSLKIFKSYTKSTRGTVLVSRKDLWKGKPLKSLTFGKNSTLVGDSYLTLEGTGNSTNLGGVRNLQFNFNQSHDFVIICEIIVTEDFGDQRFDKVFNKYDINSLIECAIESLIIINNSRMNYFIYN